MVYPVSIYLHIPFCRKACTYCDFHFVTNLTPVQEMVDAMCKELEMRKKFFPSPKSMVYSIYFGGGTPSVLSAAQIQQILTTINTHFLVNQYPEITLEANPDDLSIEYLTQLKSLGINRLSIGVQSFQSEATRLMNRSHEVSQALECVKNAQKVGFNNISIDLIFGIPTHNLEIWEQELQQAINLNIQHISVYALTVESKTTLAYQVKKKQVILPEDEEYANQFLLAHKLLTQAGFNHYELSNYAKHDHESRHNSFYWQDIPYLGIGASAHSFDGNHRAWNIRNNTRYMKTIQNEQLAIEEEEILTKSMRYHEHIMTHLRKQSGIDLQKIRTWIDFDFEKEYKNEIKQFTEKEWLYRTEKGYALTPSGWLVSDAIISSFFTS